MSSLRSARWSALLVWALVAAAGLYWALKLFVKAPTAPAQALVVETSTGTRGDLSRLLGAEPVLVVAQAEPEAVPDNDGRFQLLGVLSPRPSAAAREGVALISVDGKAAKAFRVGAVVDGQTVLLAVRARGANLGPRGGEANVNLDLAAPAPPAVGTLPAAMDGMPIGIRTPGAVPGAVQGGPPNAGSNFLPPQPMTAAPPAAPNRTRPVLANRPAMNNAPPVNPGLQTQ